MNALSDIAVAYVLPVALALTTFAMGLGLVTDDFRALIKQPKASIIGLIGQLVILPALAFLIATLFNLPSAYAIGLVLVAACPGGVQSNLFTNLAKGDVALSISLTTLSGLICLLTIPFYVYLATVFFAGTGQTVWLSVDQVIFQLATLVLLPLMIGMAMRYKWPALSARSENTVKTLAVMLLVIVVIAAVDSGWQSLAYHVWPVSLAVMTLNILAMWIGAILARSYQVPARQVIAITTEIGVQNTTLAFAIAMALLSNFLIAVPAVIYAVLVYLSGIGIIIVGRLLMRDAHPPASSSLFPA